MNYSAVNQFSTLDFSCIWQKKRLIVVRRFLCFYYCGIDYQLAIPS
jgi:hypothetical protein